MNELTGKSNVSGKYMKYIKNSFLGRILNFFKTHPVLQLVISSFLLNFTVEALGRHSLTDAVLFVFRAPAQFFLGTLIIGSSLAVSFLFARRKIVYVFIMLVWLGIAIANCVILCFRVTPLCAIDLILLKSTFSIIGYYLSVWQIVLIIAAIAAAAVGIIVLAVKSRPDKRGYKKVLKIAAACTAAAGITIALSAVNSVFAETTGRLADDYDKNGFTYSFCSTFFDRGVDMPDSYSPGRMKWAEKLIDDAESSAAYSALTAEEQPNVIFVQLESFMDMSHIKGLELSENPEPVFTALRKNCKHGELLVPVTGCGTANTEFEVLTGMRVDDFGSGEFPYDTVLRTKSCESAAVNLGLLGYKTHALHNNNATFYSRDKVFASLGFDSFTSVEFMKDVEYNSIGWAKDNVLVSEIEKLLESTEERDFIYAISVQTHGKYPDDFKDGKISAEYKPFDADDSYDGLDAVSYYIQELKEVDAFIGELISRLEKMPEDTVVVLFGDHIPELGFSNTDMDNDSLYKTDYVIWDSRNAAPLSEMLESASEDETFEGVSLTSYQLYAYVCKNIGLDMSSFGNIAKTEAYLVQTENYSEILRLLEYDTLYGVGYTLGEKGTSYYQPSDIVYGTENIILDEISYDGDYYILKGCNFTPFSRGYTGKKLLTTEYIDENTLYVKARLDENSFISVVQADGDRILRSSGSLPVPEK